MHPIVEYIKNSWKEHRNNSDKKNTFAVNRYIFPQIVDMLSDCKDIAFISIGETKDCIEYNKFEDYGHYLKDSENVLNIDFDDLECDFTFEGYNFKVITDEQALQIYDFLMKHSDKHIICHCRAGKSRSAAISEFLLQMFSDKYEECEANRINSDKTPNGEVLRKLKRIYYEYPN